MEKTLIVLKPGNFEYSLEIFCCLEDLLNETGNFKRNIPVHVFGVDKTIIENHYYHLRNIAGEEVYNKTVEAFVKGDIVITIYEGRDIVRRVREAIGNTDPRKAGKRTVRGIFCRDSLEEALKEKRYFNNVIHSSGSIEEARKEILLWKRYIEN